MRDVSPMAIVIELGLARKAALTVFARELATLVYMCTDYRGKLDLALSRVVTPLDPAAGFSGPADVATAAARYSERLARHEWALMIFHELVAAELGVELAEAAEAVAMAAKSIRERE